MTTWSRRAVRGPAGTRRRLTNQVVQVRSELDRLLVVRGGVGDERPRREVGRRIADDVRHVGRDVDELAGLGDDRVLEPLTPERLERSFDDVAAGLDAAVQMGVRAGAG